MKFLSGINRDGLRAVFLFQGAEGFPETLGRGGGGWADPWIWREGTGFGVQWAPGAGGSPPAYTGRLVINYPVLLTVLLILAIAAVILVGFILYYRFLRSEGPLNSRLTELEKSIRDLYRKQQEDLDGLLRLLQASSVKGREEEAHPPQQDLEEDTRVGKKKEPG
jgi:hypothetical protein